MCSKKFEIYNRNAFCLNISSQPKRMECDQNLVVYTAPKLKKFLKNLAWVWLAQTLFSVLHTAAQEVETKHIFLTAFLWNFFLWRDGWHGGVPPHLVQPCCVALRQALDSGLISRLVWGLCQLGSSSQVETSCGPWQDLYMSPGPMLFD